MKAFRFTLEPLRVVRERQEHEAMEKYSQALLEVQQRKQALESVEREVQWVREEIKRRLVEGALTAYIVQQQLCSTHLETCRKKAAAAVVESEGKVKKAMQAVLAARRECEIVDKFLARQKAVYDRALTVEEQKVLDELASRRLDPALNWRTQDYA